MMTLTLLLLPSTTAVVVVILTFLTRAPPYANGLVAYNAHNHIKLRRGWTRQQQQPSSPAGRRRLIQPLLAATTTGSSLLSSTTTSNIVVNDISENDAVRSSSSLSLPSQQQQQQQRTALSMTIDELSTALGGKGRARIAWDCYVEGVDPQYLFHPSLSPISLSSSSSLGGTSISTIPREYHHQNNNNNNHLEQLKKQILPTPRQTQSLGTSTLGLLSNLHSHCANGQIENGLATLVHTSSSSSDGTTKLLLRLVDGLEVETVIIPFWNDDNNRNGGGRTTVCISSQVGCKQACQFCATGKMGKVRNLTIDEILVQLFFAKKIVRLSGGSTGTRQQADDAVNNDADEIIPATNDAAGPRMITMQEPPPLPKITNIVFMGMGEPSDNAPAVRRAIDIMTQNELFQLSAGRVTVSTVAPTPQSFAEFDDSRCVLAWSVHAARDELRRQLVPTTKYTMAELRGGLIRALKNRPRLLRTCMIEVALIDRVNDSIREAEEMAEFIRHIYDSVPGSKVVCNLIPYNDIGAAGTKAGYFRKPSMERVLAYQQRLQAAGIRVHVRGTRGDDESAACGQLVTMKKKPMMEEDCVE